MTNRLIKRLPATVVTADSAVDTEALFSVEEYERLVEVRDRTSPRNQILLNVDSYEQYERLVFLRWLVETGRVTD